MMLNSIYLKVNGYETDYRMQMVLSVYLHCRVGRCPVHIR